MPSCSAKIEAVRRSSSPRRGGCSAGSCAGLQTACGHMALVAVAGCRVTCKPRRLPSPAAHGRRRYRWRSCRPGRCGGRPRPSGLATRVRGSGRARSHRETTHRPGPASAAGFRARRRSITSTLERAKAEAPRAGGPGGKERVGGGEGLGEGGQRAGDVGGGQREGLEAGEADRAGVARRRPSASGQHVEPGAKAKFGHVKAGRGSRAGRSLPARNTWRVSARPPASAEIGVVEAASTPADRPSAIQPALVLAMSSGLPLSAQTWRRAQAMATVGCDGAWAAASFGLACAWECARRGAPGCG